MSKQLRDKEEKKDKRVSEIETRFKELKTKLFKLGSWFQQYAPSFSTFLIHCVKKATLLSDIG